MGLNTTTVLNKLMAYIRMFGLYTMLMVIPTKRWNGWSREEPVGTCAHTILSTTSTYWANPFSRSGLGFTLDTGLTALSPA
jgi:hypothetical protein